MSRFIKKALEKVHRLDKSQLEDFLRDVVAENELYETAFASMANGLVVCSRDHQILFHNKAAERLLPLHHQELPEKLLWTVIKDPDVAGFLQAALERHETISNREFTLDSSAGPRILSFSLLPLVKDGQIQGNILGVQDVTDRKGREARLRRAESLASLTTLAAGVAHEIKNPLGSIGIHLQLIQKALAAFPEAKTPMITKGLDVIAEEVERLNGIVVDFLFAVRPMDTVLTAGSLNKVVTDLLEFLQYELREAKVEALLDLDSGDDTIQMDERFLKQALLNMVKNSMHAMPDGGRLTITTLVQKDQVQLSVTDTGQGIPEELMEKIFEPYFTTKSFGSGLGLTLVYKIVKEHGADIQVASKVGAGTTITLIFPVHPKETPLLDFKGDSE